jgi:Ni,Fe-hydrogenase III small subunit/ferredoxin
MFTALLARLKQRHRTFKYPDGAPPPLPERFRGCPVIDPAKCSGCADCAKVCPTGAISLPAARKIDLGKCIFCGACQEACERNAINFAQDFQLGEFTRQALLKETGVTCTPPEKKKHIFSRSLKLRQVCAGGCNACEADTNVLQTIGWDLSRFGIQFVASPRHADGLLITGPVTKNMRLALEKTYAAVAQPKLVIVVGSCAISGGVFAGHPEQDNGVEGIIPIDMYIPGCPPHPLTILEGLLRLRG